MAYKRKKKASKPAKSRPERKSSPETEDKKKLLARIHDRFQVMTEADEENRRCAMEDLEFVNVPGAQWDPNMKKERGTLPCYEFNKLRINGKRVINEIRANRPQGKVRAVEGGDKEGAELREGLCRNIANMSDFETITDQQAEYQVDGGMGAWRVVTEYSDDTAFDQDILIKPIKNPFCLYADPTCQDILKRDAEDWILTERISNKAYETKYGNADKSDFEGVDFDDQEEWQDDETVRIVEYWYKKPYDKEIMLVDTPTGRLTVDGSSDEAPGVKAKIAAGEYNLIKSRVAKCHRIMMCVASGSAILEGPVERPGTQFPFVIVYGEWKVVDGEVRWHGLHRFSKDAQRVYNLDRTAGAVAAHQAAKSQWWATPEQAKGQEPMWGEAHRKNYPYMLYNPDPKAPGPPVRMAGPELPIAFMSLAEIDSQDIRDTSGLHEASFGEESQEKSGVALARKQHQASIVTYNFPDNMAKGVKRTWEILLDYIPEIYDTERELRIIGADGAEDYATVNELVPAVGPDGMPTTVRVNDMAAGKYDVTVTTGPSYLTQSQEVTQILGELAAKNPGVMQVGGDLLLKAMGLATGLNQLDELGDRWQTILPPPIQKQLGEGKQQPPEVQQAMAQVDQAMQMVQQQTQLVQQAAQEVQQDKAVADKSKAQVDTAIANLKTQQAQFDAHVEREMAKIVKATADLTLKEAQSVAGQAQQGASNDRESLSAEVQQAVLGIQQLAQDFQQQAIATLTQIMAKNQAQVVVAPSPRPRQIRASRDRATGDLVATPIYDPEPTGLQ